MEELAIILANVTMLRPDEPDGICNYRVEHRLYLGGRGCNNAEHLPCRGLLLQSLTEGAIAILQFVEQPHVLDSNDRLAGERLQERDLLAR